VGRWGNLAGMARPLRIEVAGGWYHVTGRGNERRALFRDEQDRKLAGRMAEGEDRLSKCRMRGCDPKAVRRKGPTVMTMRYTLFNAVNIFAISLALNLIYRAHEISPGWKDAVILVCLVVATNVAALCILSNKVVRP
jgi:hypothetical protein